MCILVTKRTHRQAAEDGLVELRVCAAREESVELVEETQVAGLMSLARLHCRAVVVKGVRVLALGPAAVAVLLVVHIEIWWDTPSAASLCNLRSMCDLTDTHCGGGMWYWAVSEVASKPSLMN